MIGSTIFAALLAAQSPGGAQAAQTLRLSQENKAVIRCSAAFALVAARQDNGDEAALQWPRLDQRGREFFVIGLAGIMDQHSLDRTAVTRLVREESVRINEAGDLDEIMPACLLMLNASGL